MVEHPATEHRYNPLWDDAAPRRGKRRASRLAIVLSLAAHAGVGYFIYETKFVARYQLHSDDKALVVDMVPRTRPPPPPEAPPPPPPKEIAPPEPRVTPHYTDLPLDLGATPVLTLPPVDPPKPEPPTIEAPKPPPPRAITNPNWSSRPSGEDMARYYPERAQRLEKSGSATLQCQVTAKGAVADCSVLSEDPAGFAFGEAALKLSKMFKMKPRLEDGQAVEGATVRIPIVFRLAD